MTLSRAILLGAALLFLFWLGGHDLWAPDEPYFAEGAREMVADGKWAVPHVNGVVTTDKPPLFFWLIALFSLPFGTVTTWTARLPSALAALGTVAITMNLGHRFYGPRTAALAGAVLATSYLFWEKARWSQTDAVLCFLIWCALGSFALFRAGDLSGVRAGLIFWISMALAVLNKGPVGLLLPLGIALVVLAGDRSLGSWRRFAPWTGPLAFLGITGAWILFVTFGGGGEYSVWGALKEHFVDRGIHGYHHKQPPWYYAEVLPAILLPWTFLVPGALVLAWRRRTHWDRFFLTLACFVVIFFSISTEKRELYVLPAFPAFAIMVASFGAALTGWQEPAGSQDLPLSRRWGTIAQMLLGGLLVAIGLYAPTARLMVTFVPVWVAYVFGAIVITTGLAVVAFAYRGSVLRSMLASAAGFSVLLLFVASVVWPFYETIKSARPFSLVMKNETQGAREAGRPVMCFGLANLPEHFAYYTDGVYTLETDDPKTLAEHLDNPEKTFAVVNGNRLAELPEGLQGSLVTIHETTLARRRVLLVTNGKEP
ncbi:MAG: ArnT family glycosyltransferase [Thermoanaerobaculia bacterium]